MVTIFTDLMFVFVFFLNGLSKSCGNYRKPKSDKPVTEDGFK